MRGFSMNIFFQKMLRCIPADVNVSVRDYPLSTFYVLANKEPEWFGRRGTQRLMQTILGISTKAEL